MLATLLFLLLLLQLPAAAVRKSRLPGKPEWHFSVKSCVNLSPSLLVVLIGLPPGGLFSPQASMGGEWGVPGWGCCRGRGCAGAWGSVSRSLLCCSSPGRQLRAALLSVGPCWSPSKVKELGREAQASPPQRGWMQTLVPGEALGLCHSWWDPPH